MKKKHLKVVVFAMLLLQISCYDKNAFTPTEYEGISLEEAAKIIPLSKLTNDQILVQEYVIKTPVIAHRGTRDYAPEETEAAYRYARYVGADYLQVDIQTSKDGDLIVFKGNISSKNSNIEEVFPEVNMYFPDYNDIPLNFFTTEELKRLDVGTKLSSGLKTYYRKGFEGLQILTLKEVINICEGNMPDGTPDSADLGNRPGIYVRVYDAATNIGTGSIHMLKKELESVGWYNEDMNKLKSIYTVESKVSVANTKGRVIIATQERASLSMVKTEFQGKVPTAFWLYYTRVDNTNIEEYAEYINYGVDNGAHFICPTISSSKETNDLLQLWHSDLIRRTHARIQGYVVDTKADMAQYTFNNISESKGNKYELEYDLTDGFITDRPDYAKYFYGEYYLGDKIIPKPPSASSTTRNVVFTELGYEK